ncbi:MAG: hypothetical protein WC551_10515 [Patescibacteria group bacterium]
MRKFTILEGAVLGVVLAVTLVFAGTAVKDGAGVSTQGASQYFRQNASSDNVTPVSLDNPLPVTSYPAFDPGTETSLRNINATNDTFTYGTGDTGLYVDCSGFKYVAINVKVAGTTPTYDLTPKFGSSTLGAYINGQKRTVTSNERYIIEVDGNSRFSIFADGISGTDPVCNITGTPFN